MADYYVVGAGTERLPSDRRTEREQRYAVSGGPMAARNAAGAGGGGGADRRSLSPSPSISDGISRRFCGCASSASSSKVGGVMVSDSPTQWLSTDAKAAEELEDMRVRDGAGGGRGGAVDPAVAAKRKSKIRRLEILKKAIYGAALAMLTAILLIQVAQCLGMYLAEPTYFSSHIVPQKEAPFPAFTICVEENRYKPEVLEAHGLESVKRYNNKVNMTWSSNDTSVSDKEFFDLITWKVDEIFSEIYIRFFKADSDGTAYTKLNLTGDLCASFKEQRHRSFGKCYTLHPEPKMLNLGIYYIRMKIKVPVKIYFHAKDQYLDLSGRMGYKAYVGEDMQAQINYEDIKLISRKRDDGNLTCAFQNYDSCMYGALENHMMAAHGCVVPYIVSEKPICTDSKAINDTFWIAWNRVTNQMDDCAVPCEAVTVSVSGKNTKNTSNSYGRAYFYFAPRVVTNEEKFFYGFVSTLAEIGGYVGLLLGVSLLHLASLINRFLDQKIKETEMEGQAEVDAWKKRSKNKVHLRDVGLT